MSETVTGSGGALIPGTAAAVDTLGLNGVYFDPVWRVEVRLSRLERALLDTWWVRRLAFVSHAGAAAITTTQTYSRLEHSLGVLALVAHFAPTNATARAVALLHDIGHLPFSHTLEGLAGLDHHELTRTRIRDLAPILDEHGLDADELIQIDTGTIPSPLHSRPGRMNLDHLESFARSGHAHGRTVTPPALMLSHIRVKDGTVDADEATAYELVDLVAGEARAQRSEANVIPVAVLRHAVDAVLQSREGIAAEDLAVMTDDQLWAALLRHPRTSALIRRLRERPSYWRASAAAEPVAAHSDAEISHRISRGYLDVPTVNGVPLNSAAIGALQRDLPLWFTIGPRGGR